MAAALPLGAAIAPRYADAQCSGGKTGGKTFVLVHGAWAGGWCWTRVAEPLAAAGHRVYAPTQTGCGERSHLISNSITLDVVTKDLINVLEWEDLTDVVLVAHSFGGVAATAAADQQRQRIRQIVYLDAMILQHGQSAFSSFSPELVAARRKLALESSAGLSMPVPDPKSFGIVDAGDSAWFEAKCTPHPISTYESALTLKYPVGNGLPATYVAVKPDYEPLTTSRAYAKSRPEWHYVEIEAGHAAMVTSPAAVLAILQSL